MEHAVRIARLPSDMKFPPDLCDRIAFDSSRGRLVYRGFMCKSDYDRLVRLHRDLEYCRAIDELFRLSSEAAWRMPRVKVWLAAAAVLLAGGMLVLAGFMLCGRWGR